MSDLISRADAIGVLMETIAPPSVILDTLVMRIDALPSADARPTGEWTITLTDDGFGGENTHLICSVCGSEPLAWSSRKFFRYCPSCGAKMGGGDSE